jgi:hypothetical protein
LLPKRIPEKFLLKHSEEIITDCPVIFREFLGKREDMLWVYISLLAIFSEFTGLEM